MQSLFAFIGYICVFRFLEPYLRTAFNIIKNYLRSVICGQPKWTEKYGSWAVVTGSTDGIGRAYANELAERGMNIVLISRSQEKLDRVADEIKNQFQVQTKTIQADFKNSPTIMEGIERELQDLEIGILVNNVGVASDHPIAFHEMLDASVLEHIQVNIMGTIFMTKMILPKMRQRNKGAIINVSSVVESAPWPFFSMYSATKAFIKNFTLALQNENRDSAITIQLVSPSIVKTKLATYSPSCHQLADLLAPNPVTYAREAVQTLGNSSHTAGYKFHNIQFILQSIPNIYTITFIMGLFSRIFKYQYDESLKRKENEQEQIHIKDN